MISSVTVARLILAHYRKDEYLFRMAALGALKTCREKGFKKATEIIEKCLRESEENEKVNSTRDNKIDG